ncbi:MAG TPA: xanthine dehydrogenase family protein molybdopterin-binding subunit [Beijerinckiaceae bacterium]|nr:xanthine dehydrogenase family protein molybdopterin-binding subunit [Beijerinckiaceae bacterium]
MDGQDGVAFQAIGKPLRRIEDLRLVRGRGKFADDFNLEGQAHAAMVRSPHPHARILRVASSNALKMPGVLAVLTGADCLAEGLRPIPHDPVPKTRYDMKLTGPGGAPVFIGPHLLLPADKARHVGEAVAMVVAETEAAALDAAEAVIVEYDVLPWVSDQRLAIEPGAPAVWDEAADNVLVDTMFGNVAATDRAFAAAAHIVKGAFYIPRVTAVAIEPRAALGFYDTEQGRYTLHCGGGGAVRQKHELAGVLGVEPANVRVLTFDVGGNFGSKNRVYVEYGLVLWAARKIGRPVKYKATRSEAFLSDYQGRDLAAIVELAIAADGKFLAMRADNISNVGARCVSLSPLSKGSGLITGSYDIAAATLRARAVFTNTMPTQAYRSSGRPEVNFILERIIDIAAEDLGIDRIALRRKNFVRPDQMPYENAVGAVYDSGEYEANMDLAMDIADWSGFEARKAEAHRRGRLLGLGLANYVESSIGSPRERAEITILPQGRVNVVIGTQPSGQGHETSFAQVVADLCAVPVETVTIILGDTDIVKVGGGSHSGRSMRHAGAVIHKTSAVLIDKGKRIAAAILGKTADEIDFVDGRFSADSTNRSFNMFELASEAAKAKLPDDLADGLCAGLTNEMHEPVFPNGTAICELEVDPETGWIDVARYATVDDVGRCINPMIVDGQTHGGIAQGVGQAMWELFPIDSASGQPISGSLMDYGIPHADNLPSFRTEIAEVLSPTNPLGIKAGGEGGTTPALSVIVNALVDALKDYGVRDVQMPVTPYTVWRTLQAAKQNDESARHGQDIRQSQEKV